MDRCGDPSMMMPRRKTTRAQNRATYLVTERTRDRDVRGTRRTARRKAWEQAYFPGPAPPSADDDPPF
jgi:hypothetical protein